MGLLCHHFPAINFGIFIGFSCIVDDDFLALIGCARPNQNFFIIEVDHIYWKGFSLHLHFLKFQSTLVNDQLDLSSKHITIITGMRERIMPLTISMRFKFVGRWNSMIYCNVGVFE
jgi:hypothetical protein